MQNTKANAILSAWILVEEISGGNVDKDAQRLVGDVSVAASAARNAKKESQSNKDSLIYLGEYHKQTVRDEIQRKIFKESTIVQNEDSTIGYSVGLTVDASWHFEKIFVPYAAYFYMRLCQNKRPVLESKSDYDDFTGGLSQEIEEVMNDDHLDVQAALQQANAIVSRKFYFIGRQSESLRGIFNYTEEPALMNSFYVDDLERIKDSKQNDTLLLKYLQQTPIEHVNVDRNWPFISSLLKIDHLPDGRWPSENEFFQSLMQQVAINVIRDKAPEKSNLRTVNGPPGTGKTTLLKDVFADMVVTQAEVIARLNQPNDGFKRISQVELYSGYHYNIYELIPELQGYGSVVTSNNNAAVANISKDFPDRKAIKQHSGGNHANQYLEALTKIDYFSDAAKHILQSSSAWGLFAVPMGRRSNQKLVFNYLNGKDQSNSQTRLKQLLLEGSKQDTWVAAKQAFNGALKRVKDLKTELAKQVAIVKDYDPNELAGVSKQIANIDLDAKQEVLDKLVTMIAMQKNRLAMLPPKMFCLFWKRETPERLKLRKLLDQYYQKQRVAQDELEATQAHLKSLQSRAEHLKAIADKIKPIRDKLVANQTHVVTPKYWQQSNDELQLRVPNNSLKLQDARAELFIAAIRLRKAFICGASKPISNAVELVEKQNRLPYPVNTKNLIASFQIMQLLIPVMSTTLASVKSMFANMPANSIDNVFIDESGQATPASAAGIIWRAKNLVAVGDPAQIEPIVTVDEPTLRMIADEYQIEAHYLLPETSVQTLADSGSVYGMHKSADEWVGLPLWVHRRCGSPMFEIANEISYDKKMVQGMPSQPKNSASCWINSKGKATEKQFVKQNVLDLVAEIKNRLDANNELEDIFIISPFKAVVKNVKKSLKSDLPKIGIAIPANWIKNNIGTVHTFQGKEAKIVFFIIGTDEKTDGGADWAFSKPNLLNVAVTRAKKEIYIIGDRHRLAKKPYIKVAAEKLPVKNSSEGLAGLAGTTLPIKKELSGQ